MSLQVIEGFLNTLDERTFSRHGKSHIPGEQLTSPRAFADWLTAQDLAPNDTSPRTADVEAAIALRTALRKALVADASATEALRDYPLRLAPDTSGGLRVVATSAMPWLNAIVETVASSAATGEWSRIKLCAAPDCRWAFYDLSRNGRGRWCIMEVCGNRHKTRTYRERRSHNN